VGGAEPGAERLETAIPYRLDRLPWSRWHGVLIVGLGITWILDGLEVTLVGALGPRLQEPSGLGLSATQLGAAASAYLVGAVIGALTFGELTDRFGRKRLFLVTLGWYLVWTVLTAAAWDGWSFAVFRALTGMGIGGEYAAINSTIDELIPARRRGVVDLGINGSYWLGTIVGSAASLVLLNTAWIDPRLGWRLAFGLGALLALAVAFVRAGLPESPRWLLTHGRAAEAEAVTRAIEDAVARSHGPLPAPPGRTLALRALRHGGIAAAARTMFRRYPRRTALALALMCTQAFLYNAIFFTESLVLATFFGVPAQRVGLYIFPFAVGNVLGPLCLGHLFDVLGRRRMIAATYAISGVLLAVTAQLFLAGRLDARTIALAWSVTFFFASAGASAAYLTASEIFPVEVRAMAIAVVYAVGTLVGGAAAPLLFGRLIASHAPAQVAGGYLVGAGAMLLGALAALVWGIDAERRTLEDVAAPLSAAEP
jgi:MFS family permease